MTAYLHDLLGKGEIRALYRRVSRKEDIPEDMVVKDYYIQHFLYVLKEVCGFEVYLKGGTSLSKGHGILGNRFSVDIDLVIGGRGSTSNSSRKREHFERIVGELERACDMPIEHDIQFRRDAPDSPWKLDIKLPFEPVVPFENSSVAPYVLLEITFRKAKPSIARRISSWVFDALGEDELEGVLDTRAIIECYEPLQTLCEKTEAIVVRYRRGETKHTRHYHDIACIMKCPEYRKEILDPAGTFTQYWLQGKRADKLNGRQLWEQEAFLLADPARRKALEDGYRAERDLYFPSDGQVPFGHLVDEINECLDEYREVCESEARTLQPA